VKRLLLVAALALGACAAPSSYDGLAGGTKEDASVTAPRPVSPISVSLIASSRPRLRWDLGTSASANAVAPAALTGAVVEMSRTRDFSADVKRFTAKGVELVVPEDLEPGIWFWRLKGEAAGSLGTTPSAVWEMLVRGPAAHGSSDTPTRSMVDMNGDGEPDLIVGALSSDAPPPGAGPIPDTAATGGPTTSTSTSGALLVYGGSRERGFAGGPSDWLGGYPSTYVGPMSIGGGTDINGDGRTDVVESGIEGFAMGSQLYFDVNVWFASSDKTEAMFDVVEGGPIYTSAPSPSLPNVREGADINGDGYGDAVVGFFDTGLVVLGTTLEGSPALVNVDPGLDSDPGPNPLSRIAMGGFDANGDGLADVAFGVSSSYQPTARAAISLGDRIARVGEPTMLDAPDARIATAFAAGDFDGDGIDDVALTTAVDQGSRICIWFGDRTKVLRAGPCVTAANEKDFGASLTAADLEGDGVDELLATTRTGDVDGVRVVRIGSDGAATATPIGVPGLGVRLTTIWPGRPGKARWAAVAADGSRIGVFEGSELRSTLTPPPGIVRGFGRGLR
jgi:hypothetical protein